MGDLYALDFDGVLCDSCGESYASAAKAAKERWPKLFSDVDPSLKDWMVDQIGMVRPVLQSRYENLILLRLLLEMRDPSIRESSVAEGLTVEGIVENWSELKSLVLKEWGEDKDALIKVFGKVRDEWKDQDLETWTAANRLYPGVADALTLAASTIYIVTGKQSRFAEVILEKLAEVTLPPGRIIGDGSRSSRKIEVLKQLQEKPEHQGLKLHFVEDRLATLKKVIEVPELDGWNLYLGGWGYNTQKERDEAATIPRIQILQLSDLSNKLK
ncbi:putative HAD-like domain-containing protein [Rosa chinensis]|uniref:Putative HAD-like domain-containing protein n=1 Tax=Rosa chinensis TaxID=74649 RepID=A0A2P6SHK4_ROSCH|nr:uncharacterized protein LOC112194118 isoform X2 [Rosa chinensis]PRQ58138.1 putative HAD-like domain-containing protein [Rosa chinensis]